MMELKKLRKADIFSGALIAMLGFFIIFQALQMPMKDSYGGVQNVWYVSPALFPLFIGGMLVILGLFLIRTALNTVGLAGFFSVTSFLADSGFITYLKQDTNIRFYGIVYNLLFFVFVLVPHIDFFLASTLFLLVFFFMFYCGDHSYLVYVFRLTIAGSVIISSVIFSPLQEILSRFLPFSPDGLVILFIAILIYFCAQKRDDDPVYQKRFKRSLIIGFSAPFIIGIIFKYFLLVPMPYEGLVVYILDAVWYADFWS